MLQTHSARYSQTVTSTPQVASILSPLNPGILDRMARLARDREEAKYRFFRIQTGPAVPNLVSSFQLLRAFWSNATAPSTETRAKMVAAEPFPWLHQALQDLEEIGRGHEADEPVPSSTALSEARGLLVFLARHVDRAPCVTDLPTRAVGIEFYGRPKGRVICVVKADGSAVCSGLANGQSRYASFATWREMMSQDGRTLLRRLGVYRGAASAAS